MEVRKSNKLPEGVGKKIVEALKKQTEPYEEQELAETSLSLDENESSDLYLDGEAKVLSDDLYSEDKISYENDDFKLDANYQETDTPQSYNNYQNDDFSSLEYYQIIEQDSEVVDDSDFESFEYYESEESEDIQEDIPSKGLSKSPLKNGQVEYEDYTQQNQYRAQFSNASGSLEKPVSRQQNNMIKTTIQRQEVNDLHLEWSSNVEILMRLINQLPAGVTRQTGAQIIRQTMEAMGAPMNKVLGEAQQAQDELAQTIRDNMNTIEEYRNNIRILEKEVQKYRKKSDELEDLINLFILSEKDKKTK